MLLVLQTRRVKVLTDHVEVDVTEECKQNGSLVGKCQIQPRCPRVTLL